jgi:hypothetical protein
MERHVYATNIVFLIQPFPDINLSEFQKTLDGQSVEVVENQKESVLSRKALLEQTKGNYICIL